MFTNEKGLTVLVAAIIKAGSHFTAVDEAGAIIEMGFGLTNIQALEEAEDLVAQLKLGYPDVN